MEEAFRALEASVPPPEAQPFADGFVIRHIEQTPHQAIVQKLARIISGTKAARILLVNGYVQEQAVLQRMLDEFEEDVTFLCMGLSEKILSEIHQKYLEAFFQEEFDPTMDPVDSPQKRPMIRRKKIRAYISKFPGSAEDPHFQSELSRTIHSAYSGYVHGASPHIMEMVGGTPPLFHISGMLGTPRMFHHTQDLCFYFYRALNSFAIVARVFGNETLYQRLVPVIDHFSEATGCLPK